MDVRHVLPLATLLVATLPASAQSSGELGHGSVSAIARGTLDGNLIHTSFFNHGDQGRNSGRWPGPTGHPHMSGIAFIAGAVVPGERTRWSDQWPAWEGLGDTVLTPVSIHTRLSGGPDGPIENVWGWLPLAGFHNPLRVNPTTGLREPVPAISNDPTTWPPYWPDRMDEQTPGWPGKWNGFFGLDARQADLESYYVMDDASDLEYALDPETGQPYSRSGVFYPDPEDSTRGGLGLQVAVRTLQWDNPLAEDLLFTLYDVTNVGRYDFSRPIPPNDNSGVKLAQLAIMELGTEGPDDVAGLSPNLALAFGWDSDGIASSGQGPFTPGYTGHALVATPGNSLDGRDNDGDGVTDESRQSGPGMLIESSESILAYVRQHYDEFGFVLYHLGRDGAIEDALATRPAFNAGTWWTGDEDLDWVSYEDDGDGKYAPPERLRDDVGRDGLGPTDVAYPGPDEGEGDGMPTSGEPDFDELDLDEEDAIGLAAFGLFNGPYVTSGDNLRDDEWIWQNLLPIVIASAPTYVVTDVIPATLMLSGPVPLRAGDAANFSTAWIFGADEADFLSNSGLAHEIYRRNFAFAQPPVTPTLTARAGDGFVTLSWDTVALASYDRLADDFDFEGFRLYKSTDPTFEDARLITSADGQPVLLRPIAQWDLDNDIRGAVPLSTVSAFYDLGDDTGLSFSYVDRDVVNGVRYFYALSAYDRGTGGIDPAETPFHILLDDRGQVAAISQNAVAATPRSDAAGFVDAYVVGDLSRVTGSTSRDVPMGSGSLSVRIVDPSTLPAGGLFRVEFESDVDPADENFLSSVYQTTAYRVAVNGALLAQGPLRQYTEPIAGISVAFNNDESGLDPVRTGWLGSIGGREVARLNPADLPDLQSNWRIGVQPDESPFFAASSSDYELTYLPEEPQQAPRFTGGFIPAEVPFHCRNATTGSSCQMLVHDINDDGAWDLSDEIVVTERQGPFGPRMFRYRFSIVLGEGETSVPPPSGTQLRIGSTRPFATGDYFEFRIAAPAIDPVLARQQLESVSVVPNPYVVSSAWEAMGATDHRVQFVNLPTSCTIRIFTVRGELVRKLEHAGVDGSGSAWWDLKTEAGRDIAYGVYVYHIDAPGLGETTGRLAIVR